MCPKSPNSSYSLTSLSLYGIFLDVETETVVHNIVNGH